MKSSSVVGCNSEAPLLLERRISLLSAGESKSWHWAADFRSAAIPSGIWATSDLVSGGRDRQELTGTDVAHLTSASEITIEPAPTRACMLIAMLPQLPGFSARGATVTYLEEALRRAGLD